MKSVLLDTNVLLRYLVRDNQTQYQQAEEWFGAAGKGQIDIIVPIIIIAEACFVLESVYRKSRPDIAEAMEVFLSQRWLKVPDRKILLDLWNDYRSGLHFVDSYLLSSARAQDISVLTFDEKLKRKVSL